MTHEERLKLAQEAFWKFDPIHFAAMAIDLQSKAASFALAHCGKSEEQIEEYLITHGYVPKQNEDDTSK